MAKYRKKPVVIEAVQFIGGTGYIGSKDSNSIHVGWLKSAYDEGIITETSDGLGLLIHTLEGTMHVSVNDYIIQGEQGEFYPCKPDIFELTYELA
ncbi:hypothetical protein [Carnobacterium maltaromaticum]|uniref:hypothetical protein n=1 Tax=Carnobacterium maltaromaticum TaxID=2751 RepID=UPI00191BC98B|nr:hypothetical protein [Carnobacterium maltaromaticum]CAD5896895.1 conserved hypothetical protein [Carnobacterium maltaromaticum]